MLSLCLLLALSTQQTVPTLELSCGGCSFDRPLQGMRPASARVSFPGDAAEQPAWVRLDRADKQEDKDDSFYNNWWPRWAKTTDGSFSFMWLHATPGTGKPRQREALTVVASGWSHRFNGTRLTANSSNASLWFSFAYWSSSSLLEVEDAGPGAVVLRGKPGEGVNETVADRAHWADNCKFEAYTLDTSDKYKPGLNFKPNSGYIQVSGKCKIRLSFTKPGVWFYGVHGGRHGIGQQAPIPYRYPTAIVIPFRNRTHPPLPQGFAGPIHVTKPLMTSRQFSIIHESVTVFSSAQIQLPITVDMKQHAPSIPKFATILAPTWLAVRPKHNDTMDTDEGASLNSSKSIPAGGGPTAYANGGQPPPGVPQGADGVLLPAHGEAERWERGTDVEVAWAISANHGGGYSYRLCPSDNLAGVNESCFQANPLEFAGQLQPSAVKSLSDNPFLNAFNIICNRMYLWARLKNDCHLMT